MFEGCQNGNMGMNGNMRIDHICVYPMTNQSNMSDLSATSDSDDEYSAPIKKKKYRSSLHHGLSKDRLRYYKQHRIKKSSESTGAVQSYYSKDPVYSDSISDNLSSSSTSTDSSETDSLSTTEDSDESDASSSSTSANAESDSPSSDSRDNSHVPLFDGCCHSTFSLYVMIMLFVIKHSLSKEAFSDLLHIISSVLPVTSKFSTSVYKLKETLKNGLGYVQPMIHKFCESCQQLMNEEDTCKNPVCRMNKAQVLTFYGLRLLDQLKSLFKGK